jgi:NAD(P)-dependent dehydrogenase (short-subunit alcohol dehydrogenase family)
LHKTIVITGTTSGIGTQTAIALAGEGHTIYMLVRNVAKGEREKRNILVQTRNANVHVVECDLANLSSVHKAADELKAKLGSINVLINNAGGIFQQRGLSKDGFEMTFAANHLGHFLLTLSLMPLLEKGQARIINISSEAHKAAKVDFDDLQSEKSYKSIKAYGAAKLFNIYFAQSLAEKYADKGITAYSLHPGVVDTRFWIDYKGFFKFLLKLGRRFMVTAKQGAETPVYLATQPGIENLSGLYFKNKEVAKPAAIAHDAQAREKLWAISEQLVNLH